MPRSPFYHLLIKTMALLGLLCLVAVLFRLTGAMLSEVMPPPLLKALTDGWNELWQIISPAVAPFVAIGIVCAIAWLVLNGRKG